MLWFDFSLTFTAEVEYIWRGKLSLITVIFLLGRYSALAESGFAVSGLFIRNPSITVYFFTSRLMRQVLILFYRLAAGFLTRAAYLHF